jgi:flagellar motor protein MotB
VTVLAPFRPTWQEQIAFHSAGLSERRPLAVEDTFEARAENRRVELVLIER